MVEAEVQKKLTKAAKFFSGQLVRKLGLRYAPDLRFFIDNSLLQFDDVHNTATGHLKEYNKHEEERKSQEKG